MKCATIPASSPPILERRVNKLLEISGLEVGYGGIHAVKGIDFHIGQGELVALIGSNGAGKTTTLKALAGLIAPVGGQIDYDGRVLNAVPAHQRVSMGIALVPEGRGVFARLTVAENLLMGAYSRRDQLAGTLSGGEQQMLAMARALMSRPRLLMLDEPSMGLAPLMVKKIFETIREVAAQGMSILLVEQNARLALQVSSRSYVMEGGSITLSGASADLLGSDAVQRAYLGG